MTIGTSGHRALLAYLASGLLGFAWPAEPSKAQIYEWRGDDNVLNYTTSLKDLPQGAQRRVRVMVEGPMSKVEDEEPMSRDRGPSEAQAVHIPPASSPAAEQASARDEADQQAPNDVERVDEGAEVARAFDSGWARGFQAGLEQCRSICPTEQPVYVLPPPPYIPAAPPYIPAAPPYDPYLSGVPLYDPYGEYYVSPYQGTVTAPFDGGRSRGMTLRQQQQERRGPR